MYNYHAEIIWAVNIAMLGIVSLTSIVIILAAAIKCYLWEKRRQDLVGIKKSIYEFVLSHKGSSAAVCPSFINEVTPQQFIDIRTNRRIDAAFFNKSEQDVLKHCFIKPEDLARLEEVALRSHNKWRKIEAILCLGYTGIKSAVGILTKTLSNKDKDVSYFSIISLGQIGTVEAARALLEFLKKDPSLSYKIVSVLEGFPKDISGDVFRLTDYHDPVIRYWALTLLAKFPSRDYMKRIEKLTLDMTPEIRAAACSCLGSIGSTEAKPSLIKCLKDDNWLVRSRAVEALGKIMKDAAIPEIISLINDPSWVVLDSVKSVMAEHIESSLSFIDKFLYGNYEIAKKYSVLALQDSGYMDKLLKDAISKKDYAVRILKGVVKSKFHSGLDAALSALDPASREKALEVIMEPKEV